MISVQYCAQMAPKTCYTDSFGHLSCAGGGYCTSWGTRMEPSRVCTSTICKKDYIKTKDGCFTRAEIDEMKAAPCGNEGRGKDGECAASAQTPEPVGNPDKAPQTASPEKTPAPNLTEKIGFIDRKGRFISPPAFDSAREFSEGRAIVGKLIDGKWPSDSCWYKIIDKSGKTIPSKGCPHLSRVGNGLLPGSVTQFGYVGYLDKKGDFAISPRYILGGEFHEGLASIALVNPKGVFLCGYIDPAGTEVIPPDKYAICGRFSGGLAMVAEKYDGKFGYIGKNGQLRIPLKFDVAGLFGDGLAYVRTGDKAGFIDTEGQFAIKPSSNLGTYTKQTSLLKPLPFFSGGLAAIPTSSSTFGYIDKSGELVIPAIYSNAGAFNEGLAPAAIRQADGKETWGYIRKDGRWEIKPQFSIATPFHEGVAAVGIFKDPSVR